jgi:hypothetical protein
MAMYEVQMFCSECGQTHPMGISVELDDGPANRASIGDTYAGKELPPEILDLQSLITRCPNTGKKFTQQDNNQVFLVAVG